MALDTSVIKYKYDDSLEQAVSMQIESTNPELYIVGNQVKFSDSIKDTNNQGIATISMTAKCMDRHFTTVFDSVTGTFHLLDYNSWRLQNYHYCFVIGKDKNAVEKTVVELRNSGFTDIHLVVGDDPSTSSIMQYLPAYWGVHEYSLLGPQETLRVLQGTAINIIQELLLPINFIVKIATYSIVPGGSIQVFYLTGFGANIMLPDSTKTESQSVSETYPNLLVKKLIIRYNQKANEKELILTTKTIPEDTYWVDPKSGQSVLTAKKISITKKYGDTLVSEDVRVFQYTIVNTNNVNSTIGGLNHQEFTQYTYDVPPNTLKRNKKIMRKESIKDFYYRFTATPLKWKTESSMTSYTYDNNDCMTTEVTQTIMLMWLTTGKPYSHWDAAAQIYVQTDKAYKRTTETITYIPINAEQTKVTKLTVEEFLLTNTSNSTVNETVHAGSSRVPNMGYPIQMTPETIEYDLSWIMYGQIKEINAPQQFNADDIHAILTWSLYFLSCIKTITTIEFPGVVRATLGSNFSYGMLTSCSINRDATSVMSSITMEKYVPGDVSTDTGQPERQF